MVVANEFGQANRMYINNGSGVFNDSGQTLGSNNSLAIALGDIDGDGDLDMVVANRQQGNRFYNNDGKGVFTDSGQTLGSNDSRGIALGDVDGDGDLDVWMANQYGASILYISN